MEADRVNFEDGWSFLQTGLHVTMAEAESAVARFVPVELPHDWLIGNVRNLYLDSCGWYRKSFFWQGEDAAVLLGFDGVYMDCTVYVNGTRIGDWKYGYSSFHMDITQALRPGENKILVQVRFQAPNSRWYSGAGIYRSVWLKTCGESYLAEDGTYVQTRQSGEDFLLEAQTEIAFAGKQKDCYLNYLLKKDGKTVQAAGRAVPVWQEEKQSWQGEVSARVEKPERWSIEKPECYTLSVELYDKESEEKLDSQELTIGFRTMEFTTDRGFFLNGEPVKLNGVCEHHDFGCLGAAFHVPAMRRKLSILKKMGCNAIRTSHNMPAREVMELADSMGFLVLDEAFDMWERSKTTYDYARFFGEWHERDVESWIKRDRNHPSLLMWSIGNEIYDTHADEHGQDITRELIRCVRKYDPYENAPITIGSNYMPWENARKCADIVKYAGYNYGEKYYAAQHEEHPDWIMYGSETASIVQSRGVYRFPLSQSVLADEDEQCSALGNATTSWGARSWEKCLTDHRDAPFMLGQFLWSGFDYIGEPTPYHTKNSYFGQIDTAGFPKDACYVFQAEWTDAKKAPMVHLFPYWDFNPGQRIDVRACTNGAAVELFVNGVSQGKQEIDHVHGKKLLGDWNVAYVPGEITAVAYDEKGMEIARESHRSFSDSKRVVLKADKTTLLADGRDLCFVTVETEDALGNPVENASDYVKVTLSGPGRILGMDNGDSTDMDQYKTTVRKLFNGKLLIVAGSSGEAGEICLTVSGRGLESASLVLTACGGEGILKKEGFLEDCRKLHSEYGVAEFPDRVPIRKLELIAAEGQKITPEKKELAIQAVLYPRNTTDNHLSWQVVNSAGIPVGFARVEELPGQDGKRAKITALADGSFYVRCMAGEGEKVRVISQLELSTEGLGQAFLNPYEFVSAGLFTQTIGEITNGNEKGIATARDGASGVVYEKVDFGAFGSDEITLPVFALSDELYQIEMWLGVPGREGSRLLCELPYQKPSIWNVYQEETYHLPERIKGIAAIGFVMHAKVHLKGFSFRYQEKAFSYLTGADADRIYGDSFRVEGTTVREIGNNVTLEYGDMDFGEAGACKVTVYGNTPLAVNTIHIHFTNEAGETVNRILEFQGNQEKQLQEQEFAIEPVRGKGKLELIFLPGSCFDFGAIRFA